MIGGQPEFKTRTNGLAGLKSIYGLTFKSFDPLDESGPITLAALTGNKVQVADVFTTTPQIIKRQAGHAERPEEPVRRPERDPADLQEGRDPTITSTLNAVDAKLTTAALLGLDVKVINDKEDYTTAAQDWLNSVGLG